VGCSSTPSERPAAKTGDSDKEEKAVRDRFAELQSAMAKTDADKTWSMLDVKSKSEAERIVKEVQAAHAKADEKGKKQLETTLGLDAKGVADLTGIGFLKTARFTNKYHEFAESKVEKITVQAENATVYFLEPDGDHEKLNFARVDGQWKAWLAIPKVSLP
jgi:hypothetical protein